MPTLAPIPQRKRSAKVDFGQLRDVLARGSMASNEGKPLVRPEISRALLVFTDSSLEREFRFKTLHDPGIPKIIRTMSLYAIGLVALYILFDLQTDPKLRDPLVATRIPTLLGQIFIAFNIRKPWFERNLVRYCSIAMAICLISMTASMYVLARVRLDDDDFDSAEDQETLFLHGTVTLNLASVSLILLCVRLPLAIVVPGLIPFLLCTQAILGASLTNVEPYHVVLSLISLTAASLVLIYAERKVEYASRKEFLAMTTVETESRSTEAAKRLSTALLLNVIPRSIANRMQAGEETIADQFPCVSVAFVSVLRILNSKGQLLHGKALVRQLNAVFILLEGVVEASGVEKVKTTSQMFMVVAGAPHEFPDHADAIVDFARQTMLALADFGKTHGVSVEARMGADTGPVVAGVIGTTQVTWDLFGDTCNSASRMCGSAPLGALQVTPAFKESIRNPAGLSIEDRGLRQVKGKGEIRTFLVFPVSSETVPFSMEAETERRASSVPSQTISQTVTDPESLMSGNTAPSAFSSATPEHRVDEMLLKTSIDSHFDEKNNFKDSDLEADYQKSHAEWVAKNGPHGVQLLMLVQGVCFVGAIAGAIGDDLGLMWAAIRVLSLVGLGCVRFRMRGGKGTLGHMKATLWIGCIAALSNYMVTPYLEFFFGHDYFLLSFIVGGISGLRLRESMPVLIGLLVIQMALFVMLHDIADLGFFFFPAIALMFAYLSGLALHRGLRRSYLQQRRVSAQHHLLKRQMQRTKAVLERVMPGAVINRLRSIMSAGGELTIMDDIPRATVIAMDVAGFTRLSAAARSPTMVVLFVNALFEKLDHLCKLHALDKIKTVGDAYICAAGIHSARDAKGGDGDGVVAALRFALEAVEAAQTLQLGGENVRVRIGVATGPILGGLMGRSSKISYDVFGDAMEVAERMEQTAAPGSVQACEITAGHMKELKAHDVLCDQVDGQWRARWRKEDQDGQIEVRRVSVQVEQA